MGAVYRAIDTKLGRTVALKTTAAKRDGARLTDRVRQRFLREAMALSKVEHRNVVQVLDFGFADDGTPFLVMEHLRGRDLGALLAESETPLPVTEVVDIMLAVCAALRACHRAGIIHRDLKPGNIFLAETETGREVKVLDFGVSKAPTADDLTREGQILGTPQYLAPEQIDGKVGPASDQYALGVVLYVCLTLRLPYEDHQNRQLLRAIETGTFESPRTFRSDLPEALEAIVLRAMHVSPSERFESVYALGQRLWELASPRSQEEWRSYYLPRSRGGRGTAAVVVARTQILEDSGAADAENEGGAWFGLPTRAAPSSAPVESLATGRAVGAGGAVVGGSAAVGVAPPDGCGRHRAAGSRWGVRGAASHFAPKSLRRAQPRRSCHEPHHRPSGFSLRSRPCRRDDRRPSRRPPSPKNRAPFQRRRGSCRRCAVPVHVAETAHRSNAAPEHRPGRHRHPLRMKVNR